MFAITMSSVFMFTKEEELNKENSQYQSFILNDLNHKDDLNEDAYRKIINNNENDFIIVNTDRTFKFITPNLEKAHGYTLEEMKSGKINVLTFIHPKDLPAFSNILMEFHKKLETMSNVGPIRVKTKEGEFINYLITLIPFTNDDGERVGTAVIFKNIDNLLGKPETQK